MNKLYKKDVKGKWIVWEVEVDGNKYRTISGQDGGQLITSEWTVAKPKNIGKSNETTAEEQALAEANAIYTKKLDKGYSIDKETTKEIIGAMLAKNIKDFKGNFNYPVYIQPKLDGIRCIGTRNGLFTRNGKPITNCPNIIKEVNEFLNNNTDVEAIDGELYKHSLHDNFNKITSMVRNSEENDEIEYHIFDLIMEGNFSHRSKRIPNETNYFKPVETYIGYSSDDIDTKHELFLSAGYEGSIIRFDTPYEKKRTWNLLKKKDFVDDEFEITGVIEGEGNRTGAVGALMVKTKDGKPFKSNVKGDMSYLKELFMKRDSLIGKLATIKYFALTPDGIPRFPVTINIDRI